MDDTAHFAGKMFQTRIEAQWAVFFKTLGVPYAYHCYSYVGSGPNTPFWLPEQKAWVAIVDRAPSWSARMDDPIFARLLTFYESLQRSDPTVRFFHFVQTPGSAEGGHWGQNEEATYFGQHSRWVQCPFCHHCDITEDGRPDGLVCCPEIQKASQALNTLVGLTEGHADDWWTNIFLEALDLTLTEDIANAIEAANNTRFLGEEQGE